MTLLQTALEAIELLTTDNSSEQAQAAAADARIKLANAMAVKPAAFRKANQDGFYRYYEDDETQPEGCEALYLHPPKQVVPSGERAELIEKLRNFAREFEIECHVECIEDAVNMLEADDAFRPDWVNYRQGVKDGKAEAQQAKPKTMGDVQDMCIAALQRDERAKVGDSRFESWYSELNQAGKGSKQIAREAYEAGLNEAHHGIGGEA